MLGCLWRGVTLLHTFANIIIDTMALLLRISRPHATRIVRGARAMGTQAARIVEHPNPLTTLAEDESFIAEAVRSYADNEIRPKVS
jgi:hypothetical protein